MKLTNIGTIVTALTVTALLELLSIAKPADAASLKVYGLADSNTLVSFDPNDPTKTKSVAVTGIEGTLLGIDFRPANGLLYGVTDTNNIYTINLSTGAASLVSKLSPVPFNGGFQSGFDFNPVPDRLRLVGSNDQNFRINVDTGAIADGDPVTSGFQPDGTLAYAAGDSNFGADPNITAVAYTNSFSGPPSPMGVTPPTRTTTLYGIDSVRDILVLQNPPNAGTLNTIGSLGVDFGPTGGFDIFSPAAGVNTAYAASGSNLYTINLNTGEAQLLGTIGSGDRNIIGLAATTVPEPGTVGALLGLGTLALASRRGLERQSSKRD